MWRSLAGLAMSIFSGLVSGNGHPTPYAVAGWHRACSWGQLCARACLCGRDPTLPSGSNAQDMCPLAPDTGGWAVPAGLGDRARIAQIELLGVH
jgi:hypothetical protein